MLRPRRIDEEGTVLVAQPVIERDRSFTRTASLSEAPVGGRPLRFAWS
jgi:hypothetical protein